MDHPKPKPPVKQQPEQKTVETPTKKDDKKPYVLKPHLTHRPFSQNEELQKLASKNRRVQRTINPKSKKQR